MVRRAAAEPTSCSGYTSLTNRSTTTLQAVALTVRSTHTRNSRDYRNAQPLRTSVAGGSNARGRCRYLAMVALLQDGYEALPDETLAVTADRDFEAFSELYRRYSCTIYRFLRSQTPTDSVAEDLTAHVFFKALNSAATFRGDGTYRSWLFRIAHNGLATWRKAKARTTVPVAEVPEMPDEDPGPAAQTVANEQQDTIRTAVDALPPGQREAIALRYLEDLSIEEVGRALNKSAGAVRILLHRARTNLRRTLGEVIA